MAKQFFICQGGNILDNFDNNALSFATKSFLGENQVKSTIRFEIPENTKVVKVLTAIAKPYIETLTPSANSVKVDGNVICDLLVVLSNNDIVPLTQKEVFSHTYENQTITQDCILDATVNINDFSNISSGDGEELVYSASLDINYFVIKTENQNLCNVESSEIFVKDDDISYERFLGNFEQQTIFSFDIPKDSKTNSIVFVSSSASIKSVLPSNDYFVVSGDVYTTIVYKTEDGQLRSLTKINSYNEEIAFKGVTKESLIQIKVKCKESQVVENTEKNIFNFETPLLFCAEIYSIENKKCVFDAYSIRNDIKLTTNSYKNNSFLPTISMQDNIITNFEIDKTISRIDKILSVIPSSITIVNKVVSDGELLLEGIANINLVYYSIDDEDNDVLSSMDIDVPYSIKFNIGELKTGDEVQTQIELGDVSIKNKMGRELEILAEVCVSFNIIKENISALVTKIEVGDEKQQKDYALEIYLAKENQTLWDIAKELNVSIEDLTSQNSELTLPIANGQKIISYNKRNLEI